jgi:sugar phosphate isomerase/epimerase
MTMNPRLSLAALSVLHLAPADMVACAAEAGYGGVGLRLLPATADEVSYPDFVGDTPLVRSVERRLRDTGLRVLDVEILRLRPATDVVAYQRVLETGARLGARNVLVAGNDPLESRLAARFAALCELAAPLGLTLNLEPMPWTDVRDFASALRVVEASRQPNAAVLVDAIHFDRAGDDPASLRHAPPDRFRYVQLCDAPAERPHDVATLLRQARSARMMPGDGGLDLAGILRSLPPRLPISLEAPMPDLARQIGDLAFARRLREKAEALLARVETHETERTT